MRTVILIAAWSIADAINKDWIDECSNSIGVYTTIFIVAITMDIVEFIKKISK